MDAGTGEESLRVALTRLEEEVTSQIAQLSSAARPSKGRGLQDAIQTSFAQLRAGIRELEDFADEQDRCSRHPHIVWGPRA